MILSDWLSEKWIEIFGAVTGIIYVFLEIRQNTWLWPVGIVTSAVYIIVFFSSKFYADMSLQVYYLVISCIGWYWWLKGSGGTKKGDRKEEKLSVSRLGFRTGIRLIMILIGLYLAIWLVLSNFTDSPIPQWDSLITSLSIVGTWMLARKIYEHWFVWIAVNSLSSVIFITRDLYPTVILYLVYLIMSFAGLVTWKRSL